MKSLQFASISFDVSIQEIATSWYTKSPLVLYSSEHESVLNDLPQFLNKQAIERVFLPPVVLNWLAEELVRQKIDLTALKEIIVAGEALIISKHLKTYLEMNKNCVLWNHYGPTETHVVTSSIVDLSNEYASVPIGIPIQNTSLFIMDQNQQIVPYGAVGELYIGCVPLANGYLNQVNLTAEKFIQNPYGYDEDDILYKTGDLVRYADDGQLIFVGRTDDQVKIRGFRVETGEIEQQLSAFPNIHSSLVVAHEFSNQQKRLTAYLIREGHNEKLNDDDFVAELKVKLYELMPDYMVPSSFIILDSFPLNLNGKVDKQTLPIPQQTTSTNEFIEPEGDIEKILASIWANLLDIPAQEISTNVSFFELGGHSLLVVKLINDIRIEMDVKISYKDIFIFSSLNQLGSVIEKKSTRQTLLKSFDESNEDSTEEMEW